MDNMDNMDSMNNNEFTNSFPISDNEKQADDEKDTNYLSVLNIGQILLLVILCIIICLQAIELLSYQPQNAVVEPLQINADYRQSNVYDTSRVNNSIEYTDVSANAAYYYTADANEISLVPADNLSETMLTESEVIFILGESDGRLAILSADGETIYEIFNVHINTLPPLDRDMLRDGIRITTTEELSSLLEDFSS